MSLTPPYSTPRDASDNHSLILTKDKILQQIDRCSCHFTRVMSIAVFAQKGECAQHTRLQCGFHGTRQDLRITVFAYVRFVQRSYVSSATTGGFFNVFTSYTWEEV